MEDNKMTSFLSEMLKFFKTVEVEICYDRDNHSNVYTPVFTHDFTKKCFEAWYYGKALPVTLRIPGYRIGNAQRWFNCDPKSTPVGKIGFEIGNKGGIDAIWLKALKVVQPYVSCLFDIYRQAELEESRYYDENLKCVQDIPLSMLPDSDTTVPFVSRRDESSVTKMRNVFDPSTLMKSVMDATSKRIKKNSDVKEIPSENEPVKKTEDLK